MVPEVSFRRTLTAMRFCIFIVLWNWNRQPMRTFRWKRACDRRKVALSAAFRRSFPFTPSIFIRRCRDFRSATLKALDEFFTALESRHSDLLYLHDENLLELVNKGSYTTPQGTVQVNVTRKDFTKAQVERQQEA